MSNSIIQKLKLTNVSKLAILNQPEGSTYFDELKEYATTLNGHPFDIIFGFVLDLSSLQQLVQEIIENNSLESKGYLYVAYPKKGNKVYSTFIHRDELLEGLNADNEGFVFGSAMKFSRMLSLDEVFTVVGFKVESKEKVVTVKSKKTSQRVEDYIDFIPQIENDLQGVPEILAFYQSLTLGYQKDWARFVYSAKQEKTREKRREEMKKILGEGYKTKDLYRQKS